MTKEAIIQKTVKMLSKLPTEKAVEVANFADYILKKHEEYTFQSWVEKLIQQSESFMFLGDEEYLYTANDIKEKY